MPGYLVRIELHGVNALLSFDVYQKLHDTLRTAQVYRSIVADNGQICVLPTGTYYVEGPATEPAIVRNNVGNLVASLGYRYELIAIKVDGWAGQNLEVVAGRF